MDGKGSNLVKYVSFFLRLIVAFFYKTNTFTIYIYPFIFSQFLVKRQISVSTSEYDGDISCHYNGCHFYNYCNLAFITSQNIYCPVVVGHLYQKQLP